MLNSNSSPAKKIAGGGLNIDEYTSQLGVPDDFYFFNGSGHGENQTGNWEVNPDYVTKDYEAAERNYNNTPKFDTGRKSYFRKEVEKQWQTIVNGARKKVIDNN